MTLKPYVTELLSFLVILPAGLLCYLPMKDKLRFKPQRILIYFLLLFLVSTPPAAYIACRFGTRAGILLFAMHLVYFFFYQWSVDAHISKSLAVFCAVTSLMSILSNFAFCFDASRHPELGADSFTADYALLHLGLGILAACFLSFHWYRYGSSLINRLNIPKTWYATLPFFVVICLINFFLRPEKYETYHVNRVSIAVTLVLISLLVIWLIVLFIFYYVVNGILEAARTQEKNRILEMQESQYNALLKYMDQTSKARHDFRQTIRTLKNMAEEGDLDSLNGYLDTYLDSLPKKDVINYCSNSAVNALLNYYSASARADGIDFTLDVALQESLPISDVDLCAMVGNILENAITACRNIEDGERFIQLTLTVRNNRFLYIIVTNSFDGRVKLQGGHYRSTCRQGSGIGLASITSTAEHYGGTAQFSHEGREFYTNVVIPLETPGEIG
ncbi:MAG: GHKL domain-containing protein [Lachnospiraceae bacterium]|nr:GHKL domain-containing protein [Lachnospiraceae bacterium]